MKKVISHLQKDKRLNTLIETIELPDLQADGDVYSALTRSIVSQQLSVKAAATIYGRFLNLFEDNYPIAEKVITYSLEELRAVGLSRQKASYLQNTANFFIENENLDWDSMTDEAIIEYLTQIKGVGKWTVEMILMFTLSRLDILPLDDLAIRNRMIKLLTEDGGRRTEILVSNFGVT